MLSHQLVFLHGQPGVGTDWQQVLDRLPAQMPAVAADRPGYGSSQLPAVGFAGGAARCFWSWTPAGSARLARIARLRGTPLGPDEHVNWHIWGNAQRQNGPLWRTFLAEQRTLVGGLDELVSVLTSVTVPVLLIADPQDTLIPIDTARRLERAVPDARLQLVEGPGHHLPRRAAGPVAEAIVTFLDKVDAAPSTG